MDPDVTQSGATRFAPVQNVVHKKRNGSCVNPGSPVGLNI
jgi:hypothetical protein